MLTLQSSYLSVYLHALGLLFVINSGVLDGVVKMNGLTVAAQSVYSSTERVEKRF